MSEVANGFPYQVGAPAPDQEGEQPVAPLVETSQPAEDENTEPGTNADAVLQTTVDTEPHGEIPQGDLPPGGAGGPADAERGPGPDVEIVDVEAKADEEIERIRKAGEGAEQAAPPNSPDPGAPERAKAQAATDDAEHLKRSEAAKKAAATRKANKEKEAEGEK